jgi:predicted transcriptional regulator
MNRRLDELAERTGSAKSDILRYGIALMELVVDARRHGRRVGVTNADQALALELVLPF